MHAAGKIAAALAPYQAPKLATFKVMDQRLLSSLSEYRKVTNQARLPASRA
jgi:hypothetical protein